MNKIGLYKLEKYPNLAIEKLRIYHQSIGDVVIDFPSLEQCDIVYTSSIFDFTNKETVPYMAITGGTGYEIKKKLPPEIDAIQPHLSYGFTTRGCIRNCPFCVVPEKEGYIYAEGDLFDVWDCKSKNVTLLDNNILAMPEHFEYICNQSIDMKLKLDFNQGIDFRLITPDIAELLAKISHKEYHLAFDMPEYADGVLRAIEILKHYGIKRSIWYVLCGYNTTIEQDLFRLNLLRDNGQNAYVQRYQNGTKPDRRLIPIARWANQHHIFHGMTWEQFINRDENKLYCQYYIN
jgi:hypothetical protein